MGLAQLLKTAYPPSAGVGYISSPSVEYPHGLMAPKLVIGGGAIGFRQISLNLPRRKVDFFQDQPIRRLLCHRNESGTSLDLEIVKPEERNVPYRRVNGIFWIILLNIGIFVADHLFQIKAIKYLYLYHKLPVWYQFITATFCHVNWNHLSSNLFFLYIFGKLVEEDEGNFALWLSYLSTGAGANLVSWLVLPRNAVSVGASGAVFGLFAISVLIKMSWDWRKVLEVLILGQFVIEKVLEAGQASTGLAGPLGRGHPLHNINHIAHLSGALIGVTLILLISRIPRQGSSQDYKVLKKNTNK